MDPSKSDKPVDIILNTLVTVFIFYNCLLTVHISWNASIIATLIYPAIRLAFEEIKAKSSNSGSDTNCYWLYTIYAIYKSNCKTKYQYNILVITEYIFVSHFSRSLRPLHLLLTAELSL